MKISKNMPIYVLSGSLVFSSVLYANQAQSAPKYVTTSQHKKDIKAIIDVLIEHEEKISGTQGKLNSLRNCVNGISFVIENRLRVSCA